VLRGWHISTFCGLVEIKIIWYAEDDLTRRDVFARGFCQWIEGEFQPALLQMKPEAVWLARGESSLDLDALPSPCLIHTQWIDGSVYAKIRQDWDLQIVAAWALKHLDLIIEEQDYRAIRAG
jgi:hypothetical protein